MIRSTSRSVLAGLVVVAGAALTGCAAGQIAQTAQQSPTIDGTSAQVGSLAIRNAALEYPDQGSYEKGSTARLRMVIANSSTSSDTLTSVRSDAASDVTITAAGPSASVTPSLTAAPSDTPTATGTASGTPTGTNEPPDSSVTGTATAAPSQGASGSASGSSSASASASDTPTASAGAPTAQIAIPANGVVSFTGDGPNVSLVGLTDKLYPSQSLTITLTFQKAGQVTMVIAVSAPQGQISLAPTVTGPENNTG